MSLFFFASFISAWVLRNACFDEVSTKWYSVFCFYTLRWMFSSSCYFLDFDFLWGSCFDSGFLSMACCKTAVTPVLTHWSYCSLARSHWYDILNCSQAIYQGRIFQRYVLITGSRGSLPASIFLAILKTQVKPHLFSKLVVCNIDTVAKIFIKTDLYRNFSIGRVTLVAITGTVNLVPCHSVRNSFEDRAPVVLHCHMILNWVIGTWQNCGIPV